MAEVKLQASRRERAGKGPARKVRAEGKVPAILYGQGIDPVPIEVDRREFVTALSTDAGMNVLLDIQIDGGTTLALTKELQQDPVRGTLLHADFIKLDRKQEIEVTVPLVLKGEAPGAKEGGVLEQPLHELSVRCLPMNVPESIDADVSALGIGDSLRVSELPPAEDFEILNEPDAVVAAVHAPLSEEQLEAMIVEAGVGEEAAAEQAAAEQAEAVATEEAGAGEPGPGATDAAQE